MNVFESLNLTVCGGIHLSEWRFFFFFSSMLFGSRSHPTEKRIPYRNMYKLKIRIKKKKKNSFQKMFISLFQRESLFRSQLSFYRPVYVHFSEWKMKMTIILSLVTWIYFMCASTYRLNGCLDESLNDNKKMYIFFCSLHKIFCSSRKLIFDSSRRTSQIFIMNFIESQNALIHQKRIT